MIHIWEVASKIDESGAFNQPFQIKFFKADGSIREMIAIKNARTTKNPNGRSSEKSNFGYQMKEKFVMLLQECGEFITQSMNQPGVGTVHSILNKPTSIEHFKYSELRLKPKTVKLYSIKEFNGQEVFA